GFTGLEVITSLPQRVKAYVPNTSGFNFFLIERSTVLASNYSADAQRYIVDHLKATGIQLLLGEDVERIETGKIVLKKGKSIDSDTVIWTTGLEASPLTASLKGERNESGRLCVDKFLRLPAYHNVFVAGDAAKVLVDDRNYAVMSCQHAIPQGRFAGHNAVNSLFNEAPISYSQPRYVTCLDLGIDNALFTAGWERSVKMVGPDAKTLKNQIVTQWIYPARDIAETIKMSAPKVLTYQKHEQA
ncbi:MAG: FAD-dependent oxidoreductase, partial [Gammaproteobacteria bacterium]|nr:FAD-dependent oxidoreductase [Gammaproteobacteria bacterium]